METPAEKATVKTANGWQWHTPKSSNISRYRYDPTHHVLYVGFKTWAMRKNEAEPDAKPEKVQVGDKLYSYAEVPETVFEQLLKAESAGKFISTMVVTGFEGFLLIERDWSDLYKPAAEAEG